jgi:hypothetical protein
MTPLLQSDTRRHTLRIVLMINFAAPRNSEDTMTAGFP